MILSKDTRMHMAEKLALATAESLSIDDLVEYVRITELEAWLNSSDAQIKSEYSSVFGDDDGEHEEDR